MQIELVFSQERFCTQPRFESDIFLELANGLSKYYLQITYWPKFTERTVNCYKIKIRNMIFLNSQGIQRKRSKICQFEGRGHKGFPISKFSFCLYIMWFSKMNDQQNKKSSLYAWPLKFHLPINQLSVLFDLPSQPSTHIHRTQYLYGEKLGK